MVIAITVAELAGVIGSVFTASSVTGWYVALAKPALNPPSWVFGPVWITLYALMGTALFIVWEKHSNILKNVRMLHVWEWGMVAFFIQLFLNTLWSAVFFGFQSPGWAFVNIIVLWLAIVWTMILFYKISRPAMYLLVPYIFWVSFATYLNYSLFVLN